MTTTATTPASRDQLDSTTRTGSRAAIGYGAFAMAMGAYQAVREDSLTVQIPTDVRVMLVGFALSLLVLVPAQLGLGRFARSPLGARIASVGTPLLAVGAASSGLNGQDVAWFPVLAVIANALWFVGSTTLAVSLWRAGRVRRWVALLLPVSMLATLFLSQIGGGLVGGAYWLSVGLLMAAGRLAHR
jgi:hypothetical protein